MVHVAFDEDDKDKDWDKDKDKELPFTHGIHLKKIPSEMEVAPRYIFLFYNSWGW